MTSTNVPETGAVSQAKAQRITLPPAPRTVEDTGLPFLFLVELVAKMLFLRGQMSLPELSAKLKLIVGIMDALIAFMRTEKLVEVVRRGPSGTDADLQFNLTDSGRERGGEFLRRSSYCGPVPVTLAAYRARVEAQSVMHMRIGTEDVARVFANIVADPVVLDQFGAAMNSGRAVFVHGLAGSGKTFIAEHLVNLLKGDICVPHAIEVSGEVVQVYDPLVHRTLDGPTEHTNALDLRTLTDDRWVMTTRPAVLTGGELSLEMLDLQFDPATRYYQAPPHLKANNGIFIVDDLGRQRCSAAEIMNRWIVPMDRKRDYLSLHTGYKFLVPFDVIVIFSSNMDPEGLADGAFLRRLGYKIHVAPLTEEQYKRVFQQVCEEHAIAYSEECFEYLLHKRHRKEERPLLACYPRDILGQVRDFAVYAGTPVELTREAIDWAWNNYFLGR